VCVLLLYTAHLCQIGQDTSTIQHHCVLFGPACCTAHPTWGALSSSTCSAVQACGHHIVW
jgi:hypothetical protein